MPQTVDLQTGNITGGDTNINRADINNAFVATKQTIEDTLNGAQAFDKLLLELPETVVIDGSGIATITMGQAYLSANAGTADNLDTIALTAGIPVFLRATPGHAITLRDNSVGAGNIYIFSGGSLLLSGNKTVLALKMGTTVAIVGDGDSNAGAVTYVSEQALAGENLTDRKAAYVDESDGKIYHIDIDVKPPKIGRMRGIVIGSVSSGATATLATFGEVDGFSSLTKHEPIYADATAGEMTQTRPVPGLGGAQIVIAEIGYARASDKIFLDPKPVQYNLRAAMVQNDTRTIQHHSDSEGYLREVRAYISETVAGAVIEEYTSGNQDSQVGLEDRSVATYGFDVCTGGTASVDAGLTPADAFDDDTGTTARIDGISGWLEYDFGTTKTIRQYTITAASAATSGAPKDWTFEYYNGSSWVAVDTVTGETTWGSNEKRTFAVDTPNTAQRWRINVTDDNGGANIFIAEMEMMEVATWTDGADKLSQSFTIASAEDIESVTLYLRKVGSPTGTLTVRIETDSAGDPSGILAHANATQTLAESSLGTSFADEVITFASSFSLASGTYHIVISTSRATSENNYVEWGCDSSAPAYAGGEGKSYNGSVWTNEGVDFIFAVYAPGTVRPAQVNVDWWDSTHADVVNRYDDGAGANLETQTTFKCTRVSGFDDMTLVVVL